MATATDRVSSPAMAPAELRRWVEQVAARTRPERVHWCDGSDEEYRELIRRLQAAGDLDALNPDKFPGCYLHRSHPSDVARVEHLTFVCLGALEFANMSAGLTALAIGWAVLTPLLLALSARFDGYAGLPEKKTA